MKKVNYKGRCEKRKVSKCKGICRSYSRIQSVMVDILENDDDIISFECNVQLKGVSDKSSRSLAKTMIGSVAFTRLSPRRRSRF